MVDQAEIHRMARSWNVVDRIKATEQLSKNFADLPDRKQAWDDLHCLTFDNDIIVHTGAAYVVGGVFSHLPDKKQAWNDLIRIFKTAMVFRWRADFGLGNAFAHMPDKKQAWNDLVRLTSNTGRDVRRGVAFAIGSTFEHVPDKEQAWEDLIRLTFDTINHVRMTANHSFQKRNGKCPWIF